MNSHKVLNSPDRIPNWQSFANGAGTDIQRIVIGDLEGWSLSWVELSGGWSSLFPNLKHLHLWKLSGLTELNSLPEGLETLEVLKCGDLQTVSLPSDLQILDLEDCPGLRSLSATTLEQLEILSLRSCGGIDAKNLSQFLDSLANNQKLRSFDGSQLNGLTSLQQLPATVERLYLEKCGSLKEELDLARFPSLSYIHLAGSDKVPAIRTFPANVQYANLQGCEKLSQFLGQPIGEVDRQQDENAAPLLDLRRRFGAERKINPFAKLLLIGDGRVGKSTLACRLQNIALPTTPTHGIEFWPWKTNFQLDKEEADKLTERCQSINLQPQWEQQQQQQKKLPGTVHLWDFGGQAYYHNTHRLFASAGTVFLICWKHKPTTDDILKDEYKALPEKHRRAVTELEWIDSNRPRTLDYWFDYVDAVSKNAQIALVCTHCPKGTQHKDWTDDCTTENGERTVPCFYIDSKDNTDWASNPNVKKLIDWIERACGHEAIASGIDAPTVFADTINLITEITADIRAANKMLSWDTWFERVRSKHASLDLQENDVLTITRYLHGTGHLFFLDQDEENQAVLIDQQWGAHRIYELLDPRKQLFPQVKKNDGYLWIDSIRGSDEWEKLSDPQKDLLLEYMERCQLIHRIPNSKLVIVLEPWLLPPWKDVPELEEQLSKLQERIKSNALTLWSYDRQKVSETEFRDLMKALAEKLQKQCRWFREGMYAGRVDDQAEGHLLVKFTKEAGAYFGRLEVRLFTDATSQSTQSKLCELLRATGFDVSDSQIEPPPGNGSNIDPSFFFGDQPEPKYLVAISSSGGDKAIVQQIHEALKNAGLQPTWYRDGECRLGTYANAMTYMDSLLDPPILLICLSDHYLRYQPNDGWYCSYEFARGIDKYYGRAQNPGLVVAYIEDKSRTSTSPIIKSLISNIWHILRRFAGFSLNPDNLTRKSRRVFDRYANYFHKQYISMGTGKEQKLSDAFTRTKAAKWDNFEADYGSLGNAIYVICDEENKVEFQNLIKKISDIINSMPANP
jgi:GTPase SAR1 family protein